jgi:pimeloyl-ACP methyl ester carboxylesterase
MLAGVTSRPHAGQHSFASYDGTELAYRVLGEGAPLVCLPGGPGRAVEYLGDLGGLHTARQLILLDPRGVGQSADPTDPATFRADRLVHDVDALRAHLGMPRIDLLAHSAGAFLATLYAAAHPDRLSRLLLITPNLSAVGIDGTEEGFEAVVRRRAAEPWYPEARAAMERLFGGDLSMETFRESRPLLYGRWDEAAKANATVGITERSVAARNGFDDGVPLDPAAVRAALTALTAPVLLLAGDLDPLVTPAMVEEAAPLFHDATFVIQPGAGHFPWLDDPAAFTSFLGAGR